MPMSDTAKQRTGVSTIIVLFAAAVVCLVLLGLDFAGPVVTTVLAIIATLVSAGIAATLNTMKQARKRAGKRSAHEKAAAWIIAALLAISVAAMVVLVTLTSPLELVKGALGGIIVLSGAGITAVLSMRRSDAAREAAERGAAKADPSAQQSGQ